KEQPRLLPRHVAPSVAPRDVRINNRECADRERAEHDDEGARGSTCSRSVLRTDTLRNTCSRSVLRSDALRNRCSRSVLRTDTLRTRWSRLVLRTDTLRSLHAAFSFPLPFRFLRPPCRLRRDASFASCAATGGIVWCTIVSPRSRASMQSCSVGSTRANLTR